MLKSDEDIGKEMKNTLDYEGKEGGEINFDFEAYYLLIAKGDSLLYPDCKISEKSALDFKTTKNSICIKLIFNKDITMRNLGLSTCVSVKQLQKI